MRPAALHILTALVTAALACQPGTDDPRRTTRTLELAAEARFADLARRPEAPPVRVDTDRQTVFVPSGQRLDFYLKLAGEGRLIIDQIRATGEGSFRLLFQRDGGTERVLADLDSDRLAIELTLPDGDSAFARLSVASPQGAAPVGGVLLLAARILTPDAESSSTPLTAMETEPQAGQPNVVIYLVDTLRKDHLGIYGYPRAVSPRIDAFAASATVYDRAVAQSTWTRPSVASVLTGLEPHLHGVNRRADALPGGARTLAETLGEHGYETAAFITNGNVGSEYQFDQGFEVFSRSVKLEHRAGQLNQRVFDYLDNVSMGDRRPLFLYVHAVDPHAPYEPPAHFKERFAAAVDDPKFGEIEFLNGYHKRREIPDAEVIEKALALYDAEIAYLDEEFGLFLAGLKERNLFDNSLLVFVSDHGEEFWEHGDWSHGQSLYGELLDVPLVIRSPGQKEGRRTDRLAQHTDIFATALDWAGLPADTYGRGHSLKDPARPDKSVYAKVDVDGRIGIAIVQNDWKLIVPQTGNLGLRPKLFDRSTDPGETQDVWNERPIVGGYLMTHLRRHEAPSDLRVDAEQKEASEELARELEALGYVN